MFREEEEEGKINLTAKQIKSNCYLNEMAISVKVIPLKSKKKVEEEQLHLKSY